MNANTICTKEYIAQNLHLINKNEGENLFGLDPSYYTKITTNLKKVVELDSPESIHACFPNSSLISPDDIFRPEGDTTYFTTAGVQHIETILREQGNLKKELFTIAQPVVRSQFLDKVKDGISTSFINYSIEFVDSTPEEYIQVCNNFLSLILNLGKNPQDLTIRIEQSGDAWGERKFTNIYLTVIYKQTEIGECVYIYDFPETQSKLISITDVCFGIERLIWGLEESKYYMIGFDEYYEKFNDSNHVTAIIDSIRTATLIAGEGVLPAHKDPGYRLRQVMKRYLTRTRGIDVDINDLIHRSYQFWQSWGVKFKTSENEVIKVLQADHERNFNFLFLETVEKNGGPRIYTNVNQSNEAFFDQIRHNLPKDLIDDVLEKIR